MHDPCKTKLDPCRTSVTRGSQNMNTVRVAQHAPCVEGKFCTPRGHAPCWGPVLCQTHKHGPCLDPCGTTFSLARPVQLTRVWKVGFACLTCTVRAEDPCCSFPSASWSSAHSQMQVFTQNSAATSSKPNHCQITPLLPSILLKSLPKP